MAERTSIFERIGKLDRRVIYLVVGIVLLTPYIVPLPESLKRVVVDEKTDRFYDTVEELGRANQGPGKKKFAIVDIFWDPSVMAECWPQTEALLEHLMRRRIPTAIMAFRPEGVAFGDLIMKEITRRFEKAMELPPDQRPDWARKIEYGVDWVHWGYLPLQLPVIRGMETNLFQIINTDKNGTPIKDLPMMKDVDGLQDCGLAFQSTGSASYAAWLFYICPDMNIPFVFGCTAIMGPEMVPFYSSGQIKGMMDGMKGAAEYEQLLQDNLELELWNQQFSTEVIKQDPTTGEKFIDEGAQSALIGANPKAKELAGTVKELHGDYTTKGINGMLAENLAHLWIILAVILGNIGYLVARRRQRREMGLI